MTVTPAQYYNSVATEYYKNYSTDLMDMSMPYPANQIRLQMLIRSFKERTNIIDVGCGDGVPGKSLGKPFCGFDVSPKMIAQARANAADMERFIVADIQNPDSYKSLLKYGPFDGLVCMGVMPHVDVNVSVKNISKLVTGKVFVEFRNELFSFFTHNRLTLELFKKLTDEQYHAELEFAMSSLRLDLPPVRPYDEMVANFHNPFEIRELFQANGFTDINIRYYHQHPAPPFMAESDPLEYRMAALAMEGRESWMDMFTCSAFVVEAYCRA